MAAPITCAKTCCSTEILPHGVAVSLSAQASEDGLTGTAVEITSMLILRLGKCSKRQDGVSQFRKRIK